MSVRSGLGAIDHIVVLMLENRSLDHMLGFLYTDEGNKSPSGEPFDGLTGNESNPGPSGPVTVFKIQASDPQPYRMPGVNPGEGFTNTNLQLFGVEHPPSNATATNQGFVTNFATRGRQPRNIMGMYTPEVLPVMSALARSYAVSDRWFASVPTETFPNRAFMHMATSQGAINNNTGYFTAPPIYERLGKKATWGIYGYKHYPHAATSIAWLKALDGNFRIGLFADFEKAAASGSLPNYVFLEPCMKSTGNSQHPIDDVALGEQLIAQVYGILRLSPTWNRTLLVITYDEHGGCYDHVPPPNGAAPPDDAVGEGGFDFTRFGVRVPAVLVSPLIVPGTVLRPPGNTPFDHTSVLATLERRFNVAPLTLRDAAAPDLGAAITRSKPRTDNPLANVKAPRRGPRRRGDEAPNHLDLAHARNALRLHIRGEQDLHVEDLPKFKTGEEALKWADKRTRASMRKHRA